MGWTDRCGQLMDDFPAKIDEYEELLTNNRIWKKRTVGIGVLPPDVAIDYGVTGPMLRGSGIRWDLRKARPYEAYDEVEFEVPTGQNGDTYDRYLVRMIEMRQSVRIIRQCLDKLPEGPIMAKRPRVLKAAKEIEVYHGIESPKGEIGFYIVGDGTPNPYRCHVRPPSFINLQSLPGALQGSVDRRPGGADRHDRHRPRRGGPLMSFLESVRNAVGDTLFYYAVSPLLKIVVLLFLIILPLIAYLTFAERKVLGYMQARLGPNRVGPWGLLQPIADVMKLLVKADSIPTRAVKWAFILAPCLVVGPAIIIFSVIPIGPPAGEDGPLSWFITDVNTGLLFIVALATIGVYGLIIGGWSSNNKFSLMGGLRSAAQMISYEVPQGWRWSGRCSSPAPCLWWGSSRRRRRPGSGTFVPQIVAFFIYFVAGVAESNRNPFDLPEAESELVAGYHTEYSGMRFALFFLGEYANMIVISAVATTVFLGGWLRPFPNVEALAFLDVVPGVVWFFLKVFVFLFAYIWFRGTFPRYRFDQLMELGWKWMLPLALGNLALTGLIKLLVLEEIL